MKKRCGVYVMPYTGIWDLELARRNVAHVLAAKVRDGNFGIERAEAAAQMMLYENPKRIFQLGV